ncbi:MAG: hypothetical protein PHW63_01645 [Alphaproteobacteria bacterium]|nr:hypothetical protein [Alphaproteobacteria bacterium]
MAQHNADFREKMKKAFLAAALLCAGATTALAENYSVHVEWGYTPPDEPKVTGFCLYQEGVKVYCLDDTNTSNPMNATALDASVNLTAPITNFTLTATFNDKTESPHSAPFAFTHALDETDDETESAPSIYIMRPILGKLMPVPGYLSILAADRQEVTGFGVREALTKIFDLGPLKKAIPVRPMSSSNEALIAQRRPLPPRVEIN